MMSRGNPGEPRPLSKRLRETQTIDRTRFCTQTMKEYCSQGIGEETPLPEAATSTKAVNITQRRPIPSVLVKTTTSRALDRSFAYVREVIISGVLGG